MGVLEKSLKEHMRLAEAQMPQMAGGGAVAAVFSPPPPSPLLLRC
jgi:hypothetical protein